jgi:hypothetical protein
MTTPATATLDETVTTQSIRNAEKSIVPLFAANNIKTAKPTK